jgi:hypothetical protein
MVCFKAVPDDNNNRPPPEDDLESLENNNNEDEQGPRGGDDEENSEHHSSDEDYLSASSYDSDADGSNDDSSYDSEIDDEAERLMAALQEGNLTSFAASAPSEPKNTPREFLDEHLAGLETGKLTAIKVPDYLVSWIADMPNDDGTAGRREIVSNLCTRLMGAIRKCQEIKHVVLGKVILQLLSPAEHESLYRALLEENDSRFASTITYWKLGSDDSTEPIKALPTSVLLRLLSTSSSALTALTEVEIRGLILDEPEHVDQCVQVIQGTASSLKLFNLLGMVMSPQLVNTAGLLDPILNAVGPVENLDVVQLTRNVNVDDDDALPLTSSATANPPSLPSLVSPTVLQHLLQVKPKWWRLALDGMGLHDEHTSIIASALQATAACKMNDVLSIQDNPKITPNGLRHLYKVCVNKQRMGLVLSDDPSWVATFDLVRPLNNLHRRLEYKDPVTGGYLSKEGWIDWLVLLNNLPWLDDNRKLNYVWFTLLDQPDMVLWTSDGGGDKNK